MGVSRLAVEDLDAIDVHGAMRNGSETKRHRILPFGIVRMMCSGSLTRTGGSQTGRPAPTGANRLKPGFG
ncbi:hypothetical protein GCM10010449_56530 [Streptomyces rectiviolaceus]|uniref:Uncharacterized protein n=1 Tax=Streptomyces rectiviolaceus TaxID=332591 RepID=A0ABP6MXT5_9ACTN